MNLDFLKNVDVKEVAINAKVSRMSLSKTPRDGADFRVYKSGKMFAHPDTAGLYGLEFAPKEEGVIVGCGLDIFQSKDWPMIAIDENMLFVGIVPRESNSKIDVYGNTGYNEDGTPKRSVMSNSVQSFVKESLVPMLEELYGVNFEEVDFVDLVIQTDFPIISPKGVYAIPKVVSKGKNKGEFTLKARKDILVCPLTIWEEPTNPNQVDLEDSIEEVENEKAELPKMSSEEAFEAPDVNNNFSTNTKKEKADA